MEENLGHDFKYLETNIYQTNLVGIMCAGNSKGLIVPSIIHADELKALREFLPENVEIGKLDDSLSAIGNCISANDSVGLIHPEYSKENEEII